MKLDPLGKWYVIALDQSGNRLVTLPMGTEERPQTGRVLAAGDATKANVGDRILFQRNTVQEATVDETKLYLLHEDHVLAVIDKP